MNKYLLLQLGAAAQKVFNMQDGFDIIEAGPGPVTVHRFYNKREMEASMPGFAHLAYDDVPFQKIGNKEHRFWVAYSQRFNTLAVKDVEA